MIEFPKGFLWGAATSAYQVEGGNTRSDWWEWESSVSVKEPSGEACRHYQYYQQDFEIAKGLHHNCHRLSIEWARIEPEENNFSQKEIEHYVSVIQALKNLNIEPIVTLQHFTLPSWLARQGGWEHPKAKEYFLRYAEKIVEALSTEVKYWATINEPMVYVYHAYIIGVWPPQVKSFKKSRLVEKNLYQAHVSVYRMIHAHYRQKQLPAPMVSIAKNMQYFAACGSTFRNRLAVFLRDYLYNFSLLKKLKKDKAIDFIGVNYYSRQLVEVKGWKLTNMLLDTCQSNHSNLEKNSLGWDICPQGFLELLRKLDCFHLPVLILENGICTNDDTQRWRFIRDHLTVLHQAMREGLNVLGYVYWSLIDNYEWDKGFSPRFGLVEVDYATYKRTIRESAKKFALVCQTNRLN